MSELDEKLRKRLRQAMAEPDKVEPSTVAFMAENILLQMAINDALEADAARFRAMVESPRGFAEFLYELRIRVITQRSFEMPTDPTLILDRLIAEDAERGE